MIDKQITNKLTLQYQKTYFWELNMLLMVSVLSSDTLWCGCVQPSRADFEPTNGYTVFAAFKLMTLQIHFSPYLYYTAIACMTPICGHLHFLPQSARVVTEILYSLFSFAGQCLKIVLSTLVVPKVGCITTPCEVGVGLPKWALEVGSS
jgi:hypothetical protein